MQGAMGGEGGKQVPSKQKKRTHPSSSFKIWSAKNNNKRRPTNQTKKGRLQVRRGNEDCGVPRPRPRKRERETKEQQYKAETLQTESKTK